MYVIYDLCESQGPEMGLEAPVVTNLTFVSKWGGALQTAALPKEAPAVALVEVDCEVEVQGGPVLFGLRQAGGADLWNTLLPPGTHELPAPAVAKFQAGKPYEFFLYNSGSPERKALRAAPCSCSLWAIREYQAPRRFGALSR